MKCISELDPKACTGCEACAQACPIQCIGMSLDSHGFRHPMVGDACIHCGKCVSVCPAISKPEPMLRSQRECLMLNAKNSALEQKSASGGFCAVLADYCMRRYNAVVFGCVMGDDFQIFHKGIESPKEIEQIQGSKYVQSSSRNTFSEAERHLKDGRTVLYMGTPCQIAALRKFLKRDYEKLIAVDIICHGVPSAEAFRRYIGRLSDWHSDAVTGYRFRTKTNYDRAGFLSTTKFKSGKVIRRTSKEDIYFYLFTQGKTYRNSCYQCQFANLERQGDFTCGDCGSRSAHHDFKIYDAMSALILNTEKSVRIWNEISELFDFIPIDLSLEAKMNHQLHSCTPQPPDRNDVCQAMMNGEWDVLEKKYLPHVHVSLPRRMMHKIPISYKRILLKMIRIARGRTH